MKNKAIALALAALALTFPVGAGAQSNMVSPYEYTCADLLSGWAAGGEANVRSNVMAFWVIGYMYGRLHDLLDPAEQPALYGETVSGVVTALQQACPNVPDMPIATFGQNLGNDFAQQISAQQTAE